MLRPNPDDITTSMNCHWIGLPTARKEHLCDCCAQDIPRGQWYVRWGRAGAVGWGQETVLCWRCGWFMFGEYGVMPEPVQGSINQRCGRGCLVHMP